MNKLAILVVNSAKLHIAQSVGEKLGIEVVFVASFGKQVCSTKSSLIFTDELCEPLGDYSELEHQKFKCNPNYKEKGHIKPFYRKGRW